MPYFGALRRRAARSRRDRPRAALRSPRRALRRESRPAAMVDMAVGQQDLLDRHPGLSSGGLEPRQVAARIDEGAAHRRRAPQQGAILLQRRHRDDRRAKRRRGLVRQSSTSSWSIAGGSFFIDGATASAWRMARSTLPPASLARSESRPAAADQLGEEQRIAGDAVEARAASYGMPSRSPPIPTWSWPAILTTCSIWSAISADRRRSARGWALSQAIERRLRAPWLAGRAPSAALPRPPPRRTTCGTHPRR